MFFAASKQRKQNRRRHRTTRQSASQQYVSLEERRLLASLPPPVMTTSVADYSHVVENAIVRVDDQQRLVIRTTGDENRIDLRIDQGFLQINRRSRFETALRLDFSQYQRVVMISGGTDQLRVWGTKLSAQMHPDRTWVAGELSSLDGSSGFLQIHGNGFEHVEVNDSGLRDYGPSLHVSSNRIRMYGSAGVDRLDMNANNNFSIKTSVSMTGEGFYFAANAFGDLYATGRGGNDVASLAGTRGFDPNSYNALLVANGSDTYTGKDNWSRIQNDLWDARFVDFETQRVNLLSGEDVANVADINRSNAWYRGDGEDLVGAFRRLMNIEQIRVTGSEASNDVLVRPNSLAVNIEVEPDAYRWAGARTDRLVTPYAYGESTPDTFEWRFESFDRLA